jgi:hypothetical protein
LAAILKALDKKSSPSPEMAQRMEQVIGDALRAQPQLASVLSQSSSSSSSSSLPGAATTAAGGAVQAAGTDGAQKQQAPPGTAAASEGAGSNSNKSGGQGGSSGDEIEEMANSYFQKIYTSEQSIAEVLLLPTQPIIIPMNVRTLCKNWRCCYDSLSLFESIFCLHASCLPLIFILSLFSSYTGDRNAEAVQELAQPAGARNFRVHDSQLVRRVPLLPQVPRKRASDYWDSLRHAHSTPAGEFYVSPVAVT